MASLWSMLDNYLKTRVEALTATHVLFTGVTVVVGEQFDPDNVDSPFVLVRGIETDDSDSAGPFGDGVWHLDDLKYPYELVYYNDHPNVESARGNAKDAVTVLMDMIRSDPCFSTLGPADNDEVIERIMFDQRQVFVRGVGGQNRQHRYVGESVIRFTVYGRV